MIRAALAVSCFVSFVCAGFSSADLALPQSASKRVATIEVDVRPGKPGWTYQLGETARFYVNATADGESLAGATLRYTAGPELMPAEEQSVTLKDGGITIDAGTMREPGFLRCDVSVEFQGRTYRGLGTAAFAPEEIAPTQKDPADFDAFWAEQKEELARLPIDAELTLQPERCTPGVDVFHVSIQNVGTSPGSRPSRLYGMLAMPKGKGPFPAILRVPGAGVRPYNGDVDLAARGVIVLQIGIHGIPVNLPQELYESLRAGALSSYNLNRMDERESYYYRRVYLGCIRANDLLGSLPEFDGKNLGVIGGSQGGQLAVVTAALDKRVQALVSYYPAYSDVTGYLHGRAGGWPHMLRSAADGTPSRHATEAKIATTGYYDTVNFARRLSVPGYFTWGLNDTTCPPTSTYAAYNVVTAPKQLLLTLEMGHRGIPEQHEVVENWLVEQLAADSPPAAES